ncbi:hypothetical protein ACFL9U_13605 [Thermodesulfobacteriota bacterium]
MSYKKKLNDRNRLFKKCNVCGYAWKDRQNLLVDANVQLLGYQVLFEDLIAGLFLFNHACMGTFSIPAGAFIDLYDGPIFEERKTGSQECPGYCLHKNELEACPVQCECAYVREVIQVVKNWPKNRNVKKG